MKKLIVAAMVFLPSVAIAADMPNIKPGLWQVDVMVDGQPQDQMKQCVDANTAQNLLNAGQKMLGKSCTPVEIKKSGNTYTSEVSCNLGITKMKAETKLSGDFEKEYVSETTTQFNPPMMGQGTSSSKSTGRWVGPCEDGMRPGDTIMADGRKMNVLDMMQKMPDLGSLQGTQGGSVNMEELQKNMPNMEQIQKMMQQQQNQ